MVEESKKLSLYLDEKEKLREQNATDRVNTKSRFSKLFNFKGKKKKSTTRNEEADKPQVSNKIVLDETSLEHHFHDSSYFGTLLEISQEVSKRSCPHTDKEVCDEMGIPTKQCSGEANVHFSLLEAPLAMSISVAWSSSSENRANLAAFYATISYKLCLSDIYERTVSKDTGETSTRFSTKSSPPKQINDNYIFRGMICYYGLHYVSIFQESGTQPENPTFLLFDDQNLRLLGDWNTVIQQCIKAHYQPVLLLYELDVVTQALSPKKKRTSSSSMFFFGSPKSAPAVESKSNKSRDTKSRIMATNEVENTTSIRKNESRLDSSGEKNLIDFVETRNNNDDRFSPEEKSLKDSSDLILFELDNDNNDNNESASNAQKLARSLGQTKNSQKLNLLLPDHETPSNSPSSILDDLLLLNKNMMSLHSLNTYSDHFGGKESNPAITLWFNKEKQYSITLYYENIDGRQQLGLQFGLNKQRKMAVTNFLRNSLDGSMLPAERCGQIKLGDEVTWLNNHSVKNMSPKAFEKTLIASKDQDYLQLVMKSKTYLSLWFSCPLCETPNLVEENICDNMKWQFSTATTSVYKLTCLTCLSCLSAIQSEDLQQHLYYKNNL